MTNGEKYLKDNASVEEFIKEINNELDYAGGEFNIKEWLEQETKPTLTEDERVILRNIREKYSTITRRTGELFLESELNRISFEAYDHLFQFIKERRRIWDKGAVR